VRCDLVPELGQAPECQETRSEREDRDAVVAETMFETPAAEHIYTALRQREYRLPCSSCAVPQRVNGRVGDRHEVADVGPGDGKLVFMRRAGYEHDGSGGLLSARDAVPRDVVVRGSADTRAPVPDPARYRTGHSSMTSACLSRMSASSAVVLVESYARVGLPQTRVPQLHQRLGSTVDEGHARAVEQRLPVMLSRYSATPATNSVLPPASATASRFKKDSNSFRYRRPIGTW
jgi:hypothetical protein